MSELQNPASLAEKPSLKDDKAEIERLTATLVHILNNRDFSYQSSDYRDFIAHVAPDFEARFDTADYTLDWEAQTQKWREDVGAYPHLQFQILELTTNLKRRSGSASVYLKLALTRPDEDIRFLGACQLDWRWSGDSRRWMLLRHVTMRGVLPPDGSGL